MKNYIKILVMMLALFLITPSVFAADADDTDMTYKLDGSIMEVNIGNKSLIVAEVKIDMTIAIIKDINGHKIDISALKEQQRVRIWGEKLEDGSIVAKKLKVIPENYQRSVLKEARSLGRAGMLELPND
ncbi:MAG: hypothetical protein HQK76_02315 [Desulfobacterales bacterium]|nr:hypothetical protein [Desulfobacterales bacterium]